MKKKTGGKSFWGKNSKKFRGGPRGGGRPPQTYSSGGKNESQKKEGEKEKEKKKKKKKYKQKKNFNIKKLWASPPPPPLKWAKWYPPFKYRIWADRKLIRKFSF